MKSNKIKIFTSGFSLGLFSLQAHAMPNSPDLAPSALNQPHREALISEIERLRERVNAKQHDIDRYQSQLLDGTFSSFTQPRATTQENRETVLNTNDSGKKETLQYTIRKLEAQNDKCLRAINTAKAEEDDKLRKLQVKSHALLASIAKKKANRAKLNLTRDGLKKDFEAQLSGLHQLIKTSNHELTEKAQDATRDSQSKIDAIASLLSQMEQENERQAAHLVQKQEELRAMEEKLIRNIKRDLALLLGSTEGQRGVVSEMLDNAGASSSTSSEAAFRKACHSGDKRHDI